MLKKVWMMLLAGTLLFSMTPVEAASSSQDKGKISKKDEVIYANLNADGSKDEMYVVNGLHVKEAGEVIDYGNYESVKNLTNLTKIKQNNNKNIITVEKGKFYYQGELDNRELPWDFEIEYFLNDEKTTGEKIIGEDGQLKINIKTKHDKDINQLFYENYVLQISLTFDGEKIENIKAEDGTLANNGKKELVNFTVMPEDDANLTVTADVENFEMEGMDISAIPANMGIDLPDTDEMTGDIQTLADAIQELDDGIGQIKTGTEDLSAGTSTLVSGSKQYKEGIQELNQSSQSLKDGSAQIKSALQQVKSGLDSIDLNAINLDDLERVDDLAQGFQSTIDIIQSMDQEANQLENAFQEAYQNLDQITNALTETQLTEAEIAALKESDLDEATVNKIIDLSKNSDEALQIFQETKPTFDDINASIDTYREPIQKSLNEVNQILSEIEQINIEKELKSLIDMVGGLKQLSVQYDQFHNGLLAYTNGVGELATNYGSIHEGIVGIDGGVNDLLSGLGELKAGSNELATKTSQLPKEMTKEIDEMLAKYDMSDFDAESFVSEKNKNLNVVQFVIKTKDLQFDDEEDIKEEKPKELSFWEKVKKLFKWN